MIQFNLLPDVKLQYMKAQRTKRLVTLAAFGLTGLAVFVFVLLFLLVNVFQKQHISNLNSDIAAKTEELKAIDNLEEVLTVQNQLAVINGLHDQKPSTVRLYDFLIQVTPKEAKIATTKVNYQETTIEISGSATSLEAVNKFTDILKFTKYTVGEDQKNAFSEVVLSDFGVEENDSGNRTSYTIKAKFEQPIFDITQDVKLLVPNIISTRSVAEKPTDLFEPVPETGNQQGGRQ